jgi:multidrug efflux system outer membrane protein
MKLGPDYSRPEINSPDMFLNQKVIEDFNKDIKDESIAKIKTGEKTNQKDQIEDKDGDRVSANSQSLASNDQSEKKETSKTDIEQKEEEIKENWWQGFNDKTLNEIISEAVIANNEVLASYANMREAASLLNIADAGDALRGDIGVNGDYSEITEIDPDNVSAGSGSVIAGLSLLWPSDFFGKNDREVESAVAFYNQRKALFDFTVLQISSQVADAYARLRGNQKQLQLLEDSVDLQKQTLKIVNSRFEAGIAPELDLQRARAAVASLEADIPDLKRRIEEISNEIATLSGKFIGYYNDKLETDKILIPEFSKKISNSLPVEIIKNKPDVVAAEEELKQATAEIGVAKADIYPSLDLIGSISIGGAGLGTSSEITNIISDIGAVINYNAFDGGLLTSRYEAAKARADRALANYKQIVLEAVEEAEAALIALKNLKEQQNFLNQSVNANKKSANQAESLYKQGLTSFLDVVDAQRALASAQQQLARTDTEYASQIIRLHLAQGVEIY